ncbi:MAG: hypothetical protein HFH75_01170 [Lachnospiraceae bacterium]|jgi:hypothetical protein|nr:hypothetical protein [Lachnospiraceae bacterium]MDE6920783.1 hypothetical protein [Lachnospiraceae bacterium]MDE6941050.1 hypothetical protein [Lachnospiraceae bacterium]
MTKEINSTAAEAAWELAMQYDERAKKALGYKTVLAFILSKTVEAFKGMHVNDMISCLK